MTSPTTRVVHRSIVERQPVQTFDAEQETALVEYLEHIDNCTIKQLISSPKDIELRADGRLLINGYSLTPLAFKQLCRFVAKGLYGLVADVGAVIGNARSLDAYTSPALATEIINKVVRLRFNVPDGISCKALILNTENQTVDGIVGARYRYVPSHQLYTSVKDMLDQGADIELMRASLHGRRFAFTFRNVASIYGLGVFGPMLATLYFSNSEAGEAGIHAGAGLVLEHAHMLGELKHVAHVNQDFETRLQSLVTWACKEHKWRIAKFAFYADRLRASLNIVHENKISQHRRRELTRRISKRIGTILAEEVMRKALFQGADGTAIPAKISVEEVAMRTHRDLALTLSREGEGRYHTIRELCERAAFDIIS